MGDVSINHAPDATIAVQHMETECGVLCFDYIKSSRLERKAGLGKFNSLKYSQSLSEAWNSKRH